jgi:16S rRNA (uracil1498-N3)-methyltransferase
VAIRLFIDRDLSGGAEIAADDKQSHQLRHVMRRSEGDEVLLFNGRDGEWRARLSLVGKRDLTFRLTGQVRPQTEEAGPWLLIALIKRAPLDLVAEKATELGASAILPVMTERTNAERANIDRLATIAREAAEQCGRLTIPDVRPPQLLMDVMGRWSSDRKLFVMDETHKGVAAAAGFAKASGPVAILVGPEGGFAQTELDALRNLPFVNALDLGIRVLRAETAAIAALACYQAVAGDWC